MCVCVCACVRVCVCVCLLTCHVGWFSLLCRFNTTSTTTATKIWQKKSDFVSNWIEIWLFDNLDAIISDVVTDNISDLKSKHAQTTHWWSNTKNITNAYKCFWHFTTADKSEATTWTIRSKNILLTYYWRWFCNIFTKITTTIEFWRVTIIFRTYDQLLLLLLQLKWLEYEFDHRYKSWNQSSICERVQIVSNVICSNGYSKNIENKKTTTYWWGWLLKVRSDDILLIHYYCWFCTDFAKSNANFAKSALSLLLTKMFLWKIMIY